MTKETCPNGETCYSAVLSLPLYKIIFLTRLSSFVRNIIFWLNSVKLWNKVFTNNKHESENRVRNVHLLLVMSQRITVTKLCRRHRRKETAGLQQAG